MLNNRLIRNLPKVINMPIRLYQTPANDRSMSFMTRFTSKFVKAALISAICAAAQADTPPSVITLTAPATATSTAKFAGGITINGGANFLTEIPSDQKVGVVATIEPAASDVGKTGDLYMVVYAQGKWYVRTTTGYEVWNEQVAGLKPFATKTLGTIETITETDLETKVKATFDGSVVFVHIGYVTNTSPLTYSGGIQANVRLPALGISCPAGTQQLSVSIAAKAVCELKGTYSGTLQLKSDFEYLVSGGVFIGGDNVNPGDLIIDAGVKIYGKSGADFIRISRGSQIHVNGSPEAPVIMTGAIDAKADLNTTGAWGGLVLNGNAPLNGCTANTAVCEAEAEGNAGKYGGNNPTESSGNLNYLIIKYAGFEISPGNELNGLTLNAVGSGTLIDYVQVHNGSDDGFETFGGTVNAKHLVLTGNDDDSLDWQRGWTGKVQHVLVLTKTIGDRGIEADNNSAARDSLPRSKPTVANVTMIGRNTNGNGIKLRDGTAGNMHNMVVAGYTTCVDIDHGPTFVNAGSSATNQTGQLTIVNTLFDCSIPFTPATGDNWDTETWFKAQSGNQVGSSGMLRDYINTATVNARPASDLSATDSFFDKVDYIGAVKNPANDWTLGWTFRPPFEAIGR